MGDGNIYGWHRRGVPIPHVALMCVLLFVFGRVTSSPPAAMVPVPASIPTPREGVAAGDAVDAEALRQRVVAAERERDQYKTLYQERDATLERTRRDAAAATESGEVDLVIPHQVNMRIIEGARERLDWPMEKFFVNIEKYGNTSAASVPIALDEAVRTGHLKKGDNVVLVAFGAGLTWGATTLRW